MKIKCIHCGKMTDGQVCSDCGFDMRLDYINYLTLTIPGEVDRLKLKTSTMESDIKTLMKEMILQKSLIDERDSLLKSQKNLISAQQTVIVQLRNDVNIILNERKQETERQLKTAVNASFTAKNIKIGDIITFGLYTQKRYNKKEKESIEWLVLDKQGNKALLISKYALDCVKYNEQYTRIIWENCTLRKWLNSVFVKEAFSDDEAAMIMDRNIAADIGTNDKVFLLSASAAEKYFPTNAARQCVPTAFAKENGAGISVLQKVNGEHTTEWWLQSTDSSGMYGIYIGFGGKVSTIGYTVNSDGVCVRPAIWINLDN